MLLTERRETLSRTGHLNSRERLLTEELCGCRCRRCNLGNVFLSTSNKQICHRKCHNSSEQKKFLTRTKARYQVGIQSTTTSHFTTYVRCEEHLDNPETTQIYRPSLSLSRLFPLHLSLSKQMLISRSLSQKHHRVKRLFVSFTLTESSKKSIRLKSGLSDLVCDPSSKHRSSWPFSKEQIQTSHLPRGHFNVSLQQEPFKGCLIPNTPLDINRSYIKGETFLNVILTEQFFVFFYI